MIKVGARIAELRIAKGLSQRELAERCGWTGQSRIGNYERDNREPSLQDIELIAKALGITGQELLFGSEKAPSATGRIVIYEGEAELDDDNYVMVDRYDLRLSAGCGDIAWVVHEKDPLAFRSSVLNARRLDPAGLKALSMRDDSMVPFLLAGDTVLIDISDTYIVDGEVFVLCYDDQWFVRRVFQSPGGLILRPDNAKHPAIEVMGERLNLVKVLGRVVWRGG